MNDMMSVDHGPKLGAGMGRPGEACMPANFFIHRGIGSVYGGIPGSVSSPALTSYFDT